MIAPRLVIVADDLTGALDASAPFAGIAGGVVAATSPAALPDALARGAAVVAVSTRSREISAPAAARAVAEVLASLPPDVRVMKKIDSRLKGNIPAELAAFGDRRFLVLPAIPDFGRVVRDGALCGFGVADPVPVRRALGLAADRAHAPDAEVQADIAAAVAAAPAAAVLVGARGLAQALAGLMSAPPLTVDPALPRPACIAVGSTDPITLAQVARLRAACPDLHHLPCPSGLPAAPTAPPPAAELTLLQATEDGRVPPDRVARAFAETLAPHLRRARGMLLTGGATAEAALDRLGIALLEVRGEALPGLPLCRAGDQVVVTKSGGFGDADALLRLAGVAAGVGA
ncbi:four-carbon acid sugar kinase family protein [Rhodobacteraceae bacterium 2CG4]|uniref:Four-carbon acid sugar kinase family protein n=1 Tax=Halovulum marinum TaxID=2662447 RepID=A0A6L5YWW1_9RHOB|nr:four-carbon acid sugar kinase family protein [Halovulum marinum]MSU88811.1 four-carbon acid sugar kinase family protein [Halovulum marinum]